MRAQTPSRAVARFHGRKDTGASTLAPAAPDAGHVEAIVQSHERCVALGVSRIEHPDHSPIARPDFMIAVERNRRLHDHAAPVMSMLHEQIARSESMVLLTDAGGTIIHAIGDDDFLDRADKVALRPGANWSEQAKGTNAIGTALIDETPTLVHADEHYLHANQFLTCSAAPILDPRGNILGVLDVSGDFRSYHKHTLALVRMSARMIENRWLTEDFGHAMRLHFHTRPEFIGTLMEGILAIAEDGRIIGANRGALEQLGASGATLRMQNIETLFGASLGELADHSRARIATPLNLVQQDGRRFSGFVRCNWFAFGSMPGAARPIEAQVIDRAQPVIESAAVPRAAQPAALAELRTGDAQIDTVIEKIRRVLDREIPILILGETGTGKELLARAIHADSARGKQPFVAVNCASIPESLIEAELFGYDEGAFTGARRKGQVGKIVQANGGTLFLDEIGDMPLPLQAHLLRVLQERQVTPLGSNKAIAVDVTIICATHRNLRAMIEQQAFREDLYYRLNGLAVRLPPLRERSDLSSLVRRILDGAGSPRRHHLARDVQQLFECYTWPGNVRQLFQVLRTACVMAGAESLITRAHLPDDFLEEADAAVLAQSNALLPPESESAAAEPEARNAEPPLVGTLGEQEVELIRRTLDAVNGNISEASKRLGISRNTIYRKLRWNRPG